MILKDAKIAIHSLAATKVVAVTVIYNLLLTSAVFSQSDYVNPGNKTKQLPACIAAIQAKDSLVTITEYRYKGQRWFAIGKKASHPEQNNSDKMSTINFYNDSCKIVCSWKKGGIAGLNKVFPDSVQKEKIILADTTTEDSNKITNSQKVSLPDSIEKLARLKKSSWIEETIYDGKLVYRFPNLSDKKTPSKITFVNPFYDENGIIVTTVALTRRAFWWHKSDGKFSRTQFKPGFR